MTLDDLLALLPDNNSGQIGADDLRTIVTELYNSAHRNYAVIPYQYSNSASPAAGKINIDWSMAATTLNVSDAGSDGSSLSFGVIDSNTTNDFNLSNADDTVLIEGVITGPSTDNGTYRTWPVTISRVLGSAPSNNTQLTLYVAMQVGI